MKKTQTERDGYRAPTLSYLRWEGEVRADFLTASTDPYYDDPYDLGDFQGSEE